MSKLRMSETEFRRQFKEGLQRGREALRSPTRIVSARYNERTGLIESDFANGFRVAFPPTAVKGLEGGSAGQLRALKIDAGGEALIWDQLNADVAVLGLLAWAFGRTPFFKELGRAGGRAKSEAKAHAARANGRKGGRPPKQPAPQAARKKPRTT